MRRFLLAVLLAASAGAGAQPSAAPIDTAQGDLAVTIYNNDRALVEDRRTLNLPAGRSRQEFRDVSAQIQPETVTLSGRGIEIVEQNFDFDLLTPAALMQNAVGQTVTLVRVNNIFNSRPAVHDAAGNVPLNYQPGLLDPLGRTIMISFRKLFLPDPSWFRRQFQEMRQGQAR
jgi:hypothetical protein